MASRLIYALAAMLPILFLGRASRTSASTPSRCNLHGDDLWAVHAWYFAEATTITLKILSSPHFDDHGKDDYVDNLLKLVFALHKHTVRIDVYSETCSRKTRSIKVENTHQGNTTHFTFSGGQNTGYIIVVWDDHLLEQYLQSHAAHIIENTRATYLLLFVAHHDHACIGNENFGRILPLIWQWFKALNVIILAPCSCNPRNILKFNPFVNDNSTIKRGLVERYTFSEARANPLRTINTLRSLKGATINVTLFERVPSAVKSLPDTMWHYSCIRSGAVRGFSGFDGCVLGNLAHHMDFAVNIVPSTEYGYQLPNGTYIGSLGQVVYKCADFAANSRFMMAADVRHIDYTTAVSSDAACFVVPMPRRTPQWMVILRRFSVETWLAVVIVLVVLAACLNLGRRVHFDACAPLARDLLDVLRIALGISVTVRTPAWMWHRRVLLATCMAFNVIVAGVFQGALFRSFSHATYDPPINTLQQLYDSGMPISTTVDVFQDGQSGILRKLRARRIYRLGEPAINRTAYRRDIVAMERRRDAEFLMQTSYVSERGTPLLHVVPECPKSYFLAYAVQKNSPYLPRFNALLSRFFESGLTEKWSSDTLDGFIMRKKIHMKAAEHMEKAFRFEDVQIAFYLLALGVIFSAIIFGCEQIYASIDNKKKK